MASKKLNEYKDKRDFRKTIEPEGAESTSKSKQRFVIQEHDASNHHFDFRLEIDSVLKSWAVPKGPSTDPSVKRMAILTEDHPLEYIDFEGSVPEGQYGGGTVIVWDGGYYRNIRADKDQESKSMQESFDDGKVEVWLEGQKLNGGYVLIRTGKLESDKWLLKKIEDEEGDARRNPVSTEPNSILSELSIDEMRKKGLSENES